MQGLQQGTKEFTVWWLEVAEESYKDALRKWHQYPCAAMWSDFQAAEENLVEAREEARKFEILCQ